MLSLCISILLAVSSVMYAATPAAADLDEAIRSFLARNPEVVVQALRLYEERERASAAAATRRAIAEHQEALLRDPRSPFRGAETPEVTVVQFFDYRCGYCKRAEPAISRLAATPGVRVVYKDLPILGPESMSAARAALAAHQQGKYSEMHRALLNHSGSSYSTEVIRAIGERLGLDMVRFNRDYVSAELTGTLNANQALALALGVNSTPSLVIGGELIPGMLSEEELGAKVSAARARAPRSGNF